MVKNGIIGRSIICGSSSIASAKVAAPRIVPCSSKWVIAGKKEKDFK
jgi:hypothetical protein